MNRNKIIINIKNLLIKSVKYIRLNQGVNRIKQALVKHKIYYIHS
jgi:hypothetical protein